ncbi:MAG: hypothetical protein M1822_006566 [Bathelium mastoideum]|nr:MAG: hypothetical protein M1822_006566 [Bathelium mastoideum]
MSTLVGYESFVDECGRLLIQRLHEFGNRGMAINLGDWLQKYAFDVIGEITFGTRFGFLDHGEDVGGLIRALEKRRMFTSLSGVYPFWHSLAFRVMSYLPGSGAAGFAHLSQFSQEQVEQHKAKATGRPKASDGPTPQVDRFLDAHLEKPESFPMHAVMTNCMGNIFAGSDTTGISLTAIVNNLCQNPEVTQKLRKEIEQQISTRQPMDPITFKETQSMPYLNAIIKGICLPIVLHVLKLTRIRQRVFVSTLRQACHFSGRCLLEELGYLINTFPKT